MKNFIHAVLSTNERMSYVWIFPIVTLAGLLKEAEVTTVQNRTCKSSKKTTHTQICSFNKLWNCDSIKWKFESRGDSVGRVPVPENSHFLSETWECREYYLIIIICLISTCGIWQWRCSEHFNAVNRPVFPTHQCKSLIRKQMIDSICLPFNFYDIHFANYFW